MADKFSWGGENKGSVWNNRAKPDRVEDHVEILDVSDGEWHTIRLNGPVIVLHNHWIATFNEQKKKISRFPKPCLKYNGAKAGSPCPYCDDYGEPQVTVYQNAIDRELQENFPHKQKPETPYEKKLRTVEGYEGYYKEKKGGAYTPNRIASITSSLGGLIEELAELNRVTDKKTGKKKAFPPDHVKYGFDIQVKYNPKKAFNSRWSVQKGDRTPMSEEELDYLLWCVPYPKLEKLADAQRECKNLKKRAVTNDGDPLFPDEYQGKSSKKKKKNEYSDKFDDNMEEDDEDNDDDVDDDDGEDDRRSRSRSKSKSSKRSSFRDDDDEDDDVDDDDTEEDDDEDDRRSSSKRRGNDRKSRSRNSSRRSRDEDDDDSDDIPF